ncbi:flavin-containing monooxygenase [Rhodococcoides fascians]|uniref:flavin-containing monooxygenase n=1 Tax=Rhodococcoides fascians TaxID=1828 RepID=UPI00068D7F1A|nr:NAD(P)/FAD-dependent oxidoreductase [Rhodococcus fascians]
MTEVRVHPTDTEFDPDSLHAKYLAERDKRLRSNGASQYIDMTGQFEMFAEDPYVEPGFTREPLTDEVEVAILGGGFAGLITAGRLRQAGIKSIRIIEKGGDFGGTWYWNRYPGIRCDVESYIYMPMLEELGYVPKERYASGEEIFEHCRAIGRHFNLYDQACLQTQVKSMRWDDDLARWIIKTNRDDEMKAQFIVLGTGGLHKPKLPGIEGITEFKGEMFHTSRWNYQYTGGTAAGGMDGLKNKRVAVIGTGATAIQAVPMLAETAEQLFVFQRTPSSVDVRDNQLTDPDWAASLEPGWQQKRLENFTSILIGLPQDEDLVNDRWTDLWTRLGNLMATANDEGSSANREELMQLADYEKMEEIRGRIDEVVKDRDTAEKLKPWYNWSCKRPLYSDLYLQSFNQPNVTLVSTDGRGVDRISPSGIEFDGNTYDVDCIIFATGFRVGVPTYEAGEFEVTGRDGVSLADKWADGCKSLHGIYSRGFPNMFIVGNKSHSGLTTNVAHILGEQAVHVGALIKRCLDEGIESFDIHQDAEDGWAAEMDAKSIDRSKFEEECTPGYFNNEGEKGKPTIYAGAYGGGPFNYLRICAEWRESGFERDADLTFAASKFATLVPPVD